MHKKRERRSEKITCVNEAIGFGLTASCRSNIKNQLAEIITLLERNYAQVDKDNLPDKQVMQEIEIELSVLVKKIWQEMLSYRFYLKKYPEINGQAIDLNFIINTLTKEFDLRLTINYLLQKHMP